MLVRAPIGVPSWGEARVEGRVDPRGGREGWRQEASRAFACTAISGGEGGGGGACPGPGAGAGGGGVAGGRAGGGGSSSAEEEDTAEDTSTPAVWLRGPSRLPDKPIPVALRPLIQPCGDM